MTQKSLRLWVVTLIIGLAVFISDRVVKSLALYWLVPGVSLQIGSVLGIDLFWTLTYNPGAAWGVFGSFPTMLLLFRILFIVLLFAIIVLAQISPLSKMVLAAILGGACSNIIDTFMWGHVVDMIHLRLWGWDYPVFNVADMGICIGSVALFLLMVLTSNKESSSKQ